MTTPKTCSTCANMRLAPPADGEIVGVPHCVRIDDFTPMLHNYGAAWGCRVGLFTSGQVLGGQAMKKKAEWPKAEVVNGVKVWAHESIHAELCGDDERDCILKVACCWLMACFAEKRPDGANVFFTLRRKPMPCDKEEK